MRLRMTLVCVALVLVSCADGRAASVDATRDAAPAAEEGDGERYGRDD